MKKKKEHWRKSAKTRQCGKKANRVFPSERVEMHRVARSLHSARNTINFVFTSFSASRSSRSSLLVKVRSRKICAESHFSEPRYYNAAYVNTIAAVYNGRRKNERKNGMRRISGSARKILRRRRLWATSPEKLREEIDDPTNRSTRYLDCIEAEREGRE